MGRDLHVDVGEDIKQQIRSYPKREYVWPYKVMLEKDGHDLRTYEDHMRRLAQYHIDLDGKYLLELKEGYGKTKGPCFYLDPPEDLPSKAELERSQQFFDRSQDIKGVSLLVGIMVLMQALSPQKNMEKERREGYDSSNNSLTFDEEKESQFRICDICGHQVTADEIQDPYACHCSPMSGRKLEYFS